MHITKHTDLALRVLMYLASDPNKQVTIGEIAGAHKVSKNHLVKVVHKLGVLGYTNSTQGKGGGIRLTKDPVGLSVGQIVKDVEVNLEIVDCHAENCALRFNCILKKALLQASNEFIKALDLYSVADLVAKKAAIPKALPFSVRQQTKVGTVQR